MTKNIHVAHMPTKVVCSYDDKYTKLIRKYRGVGATYKFVEKMLDEVKWCRRTIKKHFNK